LKGSREKNKKRGQAMNIFTGNLSSGFRYIPQDNYLFCNPEIANLDYLYSDSATSCIIIIVTGKDHDGNPLVGLSHLSREVRYNAFFELVEQKFKGGVAVYAQGANPPFPVPKGESYSYDAIKNTEILFKWVIQKTYYPKDDIDTPSFYIEQCTVAVGSGDPNAGFGGYGININPQNADYLKVSNKYFNIPMNIRDPEKGVQTLFCIFGMRTNIPSLILHNVEDLFTNEEINALVNEANEYKWADLLELSNDEILNKYSTTPEFEPCWFVANLIESSEFVRNYELKG
jgi:hypothetical protein